MKKLIIAEHSGYCFGVKRAVEAVERQLEKGAATYTLGEIIHNSATVEALRVRGAVPISDLSEAKPGSCVIIRSHGVGPHIYEQAKRLGVNVIDATCPFVKHIHETIREQYERGMEIIIAGERTHPEVIGTNGWCGDSAHIVSAARDVLALPEMERACLVAQTTFSVEKFSELAGIVRGRVKELKVFETICGTTAKRQSESRNIAGRADLMIVIGGTNSSNTQKMAEICLKAGKPTVCIENSVELPIEKITSSDIIGIVAGASTPDWMIREVVTRMNEFEKTAADMVTEDSAKAEALPAAEEINTETAQVSEAEEIMQAPSEPSAAGVSNDDGKDGEAVDSNIMEAYEKTMVRIRNGQVLQGTIVQITDDEVCVNIGYKSDGFIPKRELSTDPDFDPKAELSVGDTITVEVIKVNDGEGNVLLSRKSAEARKLWDELMESVDLEKVYEAVGKEVVKSGVIAVIGGVRAFIPASQLALRYVEAEKMSEFVGQPMRLKIIDVDKTKKRIVASRKAVLLMEQEQEKKERWNSLVTGTRIKGIVRRLTDFGAFVDIGGIDGLIHVTDMGWGRVKSPSDIMKIGDEVEVLILSVDPEKERVSLGYKQLQPKPWTKAAEKYAIGSVIEGRVVRIVPFGAFVSLEPTIDGLVHISQVATKRIAKVEDELKVGDIIKAKVLEVIPEAKRISLSRKEVLLEELQELGLELPEEEQSAPAPAETHEQPKPQPRENRPPRDQNQQRGRDSRDQRQPREPREPRVALPPVQQTTVSLADFFPNLGSFEVEAEAEAVAAVAETASEPIEAVVETETEAIEAVAEVEIEPDEAVAEAETEPAEAVAEVETEPDVAVAEVESEPAAEEEAKTE